MEPIHSGIRSDEIARIRYDLTKPVQSQFIRSDVAFLLDTIEGLEEQLETLQRDLDYEGETGMKWMKRAAELQQEVEGYRETLLLLAQGKVDFEQWRMVYESASNPAMRPSNG